MNIILVSSHLVKAKTLTFTRRHFVLLFGALFLVVVLMVLGLNYLSLRYVDKIDSPSLRSFVMSVQQEDYEKKQQYLRDNLNAMAIKIGQMQAQLLRIDSVGERLVELSGIEPQEFLFNQMPGQGGALSTLPLQDISFGEFDNTVQHLSLTLEDRMNKLETLDSFMRQDRLKKKMLPSLMPVNVQWYSSSFGARIDPFTGKKAYHEGIDFVAELGAPIIAAASGMVVYSDLHPEYGNMIAVDHGNNLVSRYAHASKRMVKLGQVVMQGEKIAEVGSTGRSTGPHLHFEVRHKGSPQNPSRFLKKSD
jgi:murein DD-endopeptidase MepM/ murein hydrolase activator NlpD